MIEFVLNIEINNGGGGGGVEDSLWVNIIVLICG